MKNINEYKAKAKANFNVSKLLSDGSTNAKTSKNDIKTFILYIAPFNQNNKGINLCPKASAGCAAACLFSAGRGKFSNVKQSRINKANLYVNDKETFLNLLGYEIQKEIYKAIKGNYKIAFRLNGTSDLDFIGMLKSKNIFDYSLTPSNVIFYDYTKILGKCMKYKNDKKYILTFSRSESNENEFLKALDQNITTSVVFGNYIPKEYKGKKVIDGDESDIVMLKSKGHILGLKAKGDAKKDKSNFVINL
jgi:hypothetical protein